MNKTILLVDYEQKSLNEIQEILKDEQFDLLMAFDGNEALEIFERKSPDLVITSALLPKLNGFELCKEIVSGQHGEVRPVIMFSGIYKAEKYRKEAIVGCGAVDFLEKPLAKWQLLKVVNGLFSEIPAGPGGGPLELDATQVPPARSSLTLAFQTSSLAMSDDLLEVESLLDSAPQVRNQVGGVQEKTLPVIQDADLPDLTQFSLNPLDQELEAAVDAVRTDLDSASRLRDQRVVEEIEVDLFKAEPNILEFESAAETETGKRGLASEEAEIIELDAPDDANEQTQPVPPTPGEPNAGATPQFTLGPQQPRNWLPFLVIILAGLLVVLVLWLRG